MPVPDGADEDDAAEADDGVAADVGAGVDADAICIALVGDDADENAGVTGAVAGSDGIRSERRSAPSEPTL